MLNANTYVTDNPGIAPINNPRTEPRRTRRINLKPVKYDKSILKFIHRLLYSPRYQNILPFGSITDRYFANKR